MRSVARAEQRAALAEAELSAAEAEVETLRDRVQRTVALLVEVRRQRDAASQLLEKQRDSLSWKLTEPLRTVKRVAIRIRR